MTDTNVTIGVSCDSSGTIKTDTVISIINTILNNNFAVYVWFQRGCYVHENRKKIVLKAKELKSTHVFFIDTDMIVPTGTLQTLIAHDKDIIGVNYNMRELPLISTLKFAHGEEIYAKTDIPIELFECYAVATGCMLVKMSVFDRIDKPWFGFDVKNGSSDELIGEDVFFCRQAYRKGIKVWCDGTLNVKHIGDYYY